MMVPYARHSIDEQDIDAVNEVLRSSWLTQGPKVGEFEQALCAHTGAKYAVAVSSGTAALHLACIAAGVGPGKPVVVPTLTFVASANAVIHAGGFPLLADVEWGTWLLKEQIPMVNAPVMPVYFAGLPMDIKKLKQTYRRVPIIADACHALGATVNGKRIGEMGADFTCGSTHPAKHITTGEGGFILTDNERAAELLRALRDHGRGKADDREPWARTQEVMGWNYRMTEIQAALGISQLRKADTWLARRHEIANAYCRDLNECAFPVEIAPHTTQVKSADHLFPIWLNPNRYDRREVYHRLHEKGVQVQVHYKPVHQHPFHELDPEMFPNAERYYRGCLSLPIFGTMTDAEVEHVVKSVREVLS